MLCYITVNKVVYNTNTPLMAKTDETVEKIRVYLMCQNLTETGSGFGGFMHSISESETGFAKPPKPAREAVLLMNP